MNKEYKIILEVFYWQKRLKIRNILLGIDNKTRYTAYVCDYDNTPALFLNLKIMKVHTVIENVACIFHELGHIKFNTYTWKGIKVNKIRAEYLAETFALKQIKKYFFKSYKEYIEDWKESINDKNWKRKFPIHWEAFSKIKEYKEK